MIIHKNKLPNFYILGAPKCGTTAIAKIIADHPSVYVPPEKEVRFFSDDTLYQQGVSYLTERFEASAGALVRCDASPQYIYNHKVIARMLDVYGDAFNDLKFMVMLRNPADRAYSAYWMAVRYGWEDRSFDEAVAQCLELKDESKYQSDGQFNIHSYVEAGMYSKQIKLWLEVIAKEQVMFYTQEAMRDDSSSFYTKLSSHLGVNLLSDIDITQKANQASMPRSKIVMKLTDEKSLLKNIIKPMVPQNLRYKVRRAISNRNLKVTQYEPMSEAVRELLNSVYRDDTEQLKVIIGNDLEPWSNRDA